MDHDCLRQVEEVPGEEMPVLTIARFTDGNVVSYFDEALDPDLRSDLARRVRAIRFPQVEPLLSYLKEQNISCATGHYKTYVFPAQFTEFIDEEVICLSREHPNVRTFGFGDFADPVYTVERDGKIACACVSAREDDSCGEAWVFTDPAYRHQGLAQKVVGAWASGLISTGKVPFYSHKIQNDASANLARRLGLYPVFEELVIARLAD